MKVQPSPTDWAYLAGLIDGEGCIRATHAAKSGSYHAQLTIAQVNFNILEVVRSRFEVGRFGIKQQYNHRPQLVWHVSKSEDLSWLLRGVIPYLILKKKQAELAVHLCRRPDKDIQAKIYLRLKELKHEI